jgi:thymidylate kinase
MKIVAIEGCHGSGKTKVCKELKDRGFTVLDENFMNATEKFDELHPQTLLRETIWAIQWMDNIHSVREIDYAKEKNVIFVDRSFWSAVCYFKPTENQAECRKSLQTILKSQWEELLSLKPELDLKCVYLKVDKDTLWKRVKKRLKIEPDREKYYEGDKQWLHQCHTFYDKDYAHLWDYVVENTGSIESTVDAILKTCAFKKR